MRMRVRPAVRRPRLDRSVGFAFGNGLMSTGRTVGVMLNAEELREPEK